MQMRSLYKELENIINRFTTILKRYRPLWTGR